MPHGPVICLGAAVVDHVLEVDELPCRPVKMAASRRTTRCGGPAATAAVLCARLGAPAELWSRIGRDPDGEFIGERLAQHGVGLAALRRVEDATTIVAFVVVDRRGERMIVAHGGRSLPSATAHLPLGEVARAGAVLADISWLAGAQALLEAARAAGVPSVLDAEEGNEEALLRLPPLAGLPVFSEGAFARLSGDAPPDAASLAALAARLGSDVGVTLGAEGSLWWLDGMLTHVPALRVEARDTTGAGDVFHGALALALAERRPRMEAIRFATAAAGLKCALGDGWEGMPARTEIEQAMRQLA